MKFILALVLTCSTFNAFAISLDELAKCPDYVKTELPKSLELVNQYDKEGKASGDLIDVLNLSIYGRIEMSPTCDEVEHMSNSIAGVIKEIRKK